MKRSKREMDNNMVHDGLQTHQWLLSYKTSSTLVDGRPVNILHDFYIPALSLSERYDRVAGYFRSSSLAAASQGFSTFVGRGGKMRLIVGADLQPEDVKAIIDGDRRRLELNLNNQLTPTSPWPDEVRNGVELLAWMVSNGYLEVRVALRIHGETGEPLSWESVEDGYVHEKWFILFDRLGNRLYGSGTLNESKTALMINAENIDVHCDWWGGMEHQRVEEAVEDFENLWQGRVPHVPVYTLPEAVRRRLVQIAKGVVNPVEIDGKQHIADEELTPSPLERLKFAMLRDAPKMPGGRFVGMETAPVAPWPHQEVVVRRLVETWPYTYLLCDEVGLGKTIEAGLAFRSLYLTGLVKRILIAAPASLTQQWHRQMATKLLLSFGLTQGGSIPKHEYIFPEIKVQENNSIYEPDLVIISTGLLIRANRIEALGAAENYDIALLDEAHAARRQNPSKGPGSNPVFGTLYRVLRDHLRTKARSLWLTTATPMQIDPVEVCDLLALTNRVGAFQYDPSLTLQYYDLLSKLIENKGLSTHEWAFLKNVIKALQRQDPLLWRFIERNVIDGRIRMTLQQWLERDHYPRGSDLKLVSRLIFGVSPLSRVMLRHSRRLLEIYKKKGQLQENLPQREILAMPRILFNSLEKDVYDQLETYCTDLARQIQKHGDSKTKHAIGFLLSFFRLRFASSLFALRETLKRRLLKVEATLLKQLNEDDAESEDVESPLEDWVYEEEIEDDSLPAESLLKNRTPADLIWEQEQLQILLKKMANITGSSSKMQELLKALDHRRLAQSGRYRQTVVFTRFYDTLKDIVTRIQQVNPHMLIGTFSGKGGEFYDPHLRRMCTVNREEVKERFLRGEIDLLICTDAAAEGLNLQTADLLINFDLGWNPMKVEQRIGRIDRIGQKNDKVSVLNLCYVGSAEETVYKRLLQRLKKADLIVGTQQFSLLPVTPDDFQQLTDGTLTPEKLFHKAQKRMKSLRKRAESMEIPPQDLYSIYLRLSKDGNSISAPLDLSDIWQVLSTSQYLRALGCEIDKSEKGLPVIALKGVTEVTPGTRLTVSRKLYEEGLPEVKNLRFASYGEPAFEAILKQVNKYKLPDCLHRIAVIVPDLGEVTVIGYAAACYSSEGTRIVKLVTKWADLKNIRLAEEETLSEAELEPLREELAYKARNEFNHYSVACRIERDNLRAGISQGLLNNLVISSLIKDKARQFGENPLFWPVLGNVEELFQEREMLQVNVSSADILRRVVPDLLFKIKVPAVGEQALIETSRLLAGSACDTARRQAESLKKRKASLGVESVLSRLNRVETNIIEQLRRL